MLKKEARHPLLFLRVILSFSLSLSLVFNNNNNNENVSLFFKKIKIDTQKNKIKTGCTKRYPWTCSGPMSCWSTNCTQKQTCSLIPIHLRVTERILYFLITGVKCDTKKPECYIWWTCECQSFFSLLFFSPPKSAMISCQWRSIS